MNDSRYRDRMTDVEILADKAAKEEKRELAIRRTQLEAQVIRKTFATGDGRRCLEILMKRLKYQSPVTNLSEDGVLHTENLQHNAALQGFYLWMRQYIDKDTLVAVEVRGLEDILETEKGDKENG